MGRSKLQAWVRSLTLLASVGAPTFAIAADLLPPPPPPPMLPPPVEVGGGWYLRGDVGVGAAQYEDIVLRTSVPVSSDYHTEGHSMSDQFFAGAGLGYQFGSFFRADVTGEYRGGARLGFVDVYSGCYAGSNPCAPGTGLDHNTANLSSVVVLANGYFDLGTWYGVTPYIGGGVGSAFHRVTGFTDIGAGTAMGGMGIAKEKHSSGLAWALQAGVSYDVTQNFKVDVGYRYLNMGNVSSGNVSCYNDGCTAPYSYKFKDVTSHDVKIGVRYLLGGPVAMPLPPLAPAYEPGPLVRKY